MQVDVGYKTGSGNLLALTIYGNLFDREDIPLFYPKEDLKLLCGDCKGHGGGCPDFAPYFPDIKPSMSKFYTIVVRIDMAWAIKYAGKTGYFRSGYADMLTATYMLRIASETANALHGYKLVCGGCKGCASKKNCTVILGQPCLNPKRRTYSVEAAGVDCSTLHEVLFGNRLPYWYYTKDALPQYMHRYGGIFTNSKDECNAALVEAITSDKSYTAELPPIFRHRLVIKQAPDHVVDAGMEYLAYVLDDEVLDDEMEDHNGKD